MANVTWAANTAGKTAKSPLGGSEVFRVNDGGVSKKTTADDIKAHALAAATVTGQLRIDDLGAGIVQTDANGDVSDFTLSGGPLFSTAAGALGQGMQLLATIDTSTGATDYNETGIPAWVSQVWVGFRGISTNATSNLLVQLGDSGGIEGTGYAAAVGSSNGSTTSAQGFQMNRGTSFTAGVAGFGALLLLKGQSNFWHGIGTFSAGQVNIVAGSKQLSGTLDRIRLVNLGGVNTFDAGAVDIYYF